MHAIRHSKQASYERTSNVGLKTVNSGGKNLGFGDERSWKNLSFGGGFGYRNNTNQFAPPVGTLSQI